MEHFKVADVKLETFDQLPPKGVKYKPFQKEFFESRN